MQKTITSGIIKSSTKQRQIIKKIGGFHMIKDSLTYDIVGSFLRPAEIKEARKAYKDGKITK